LEIFASPTSALGRFNEHLKFVPLSFDRFRLEFSYNIGNRSSSGHQLSIIVNEYKGINITYAIGLSTRYAPEANNRLSLSSCSPIFRRKLAKSFEYFSPPGVISHNVSSLTERISRYGRFGTTVTGSRRLI
jgi:hypothetical protein